MRNAWRTTASGRSQAVQPGTSQLDRAGAQRQCIHRIGAATKAAVDKQSQLGPAGSIDQARQGLNCGRRAIKLPSAVVRDDDTVDARGNRQPDVFRRAHPF